MPEAYEEERLSQTDTDTCEKIDLVKGFHECANVVLEHWLFL